MVQKFTICTFPVLKVLYLSGMFATIDEPMLMYHFHPKSIVQCEFFMYLKVNTFKYQILSFFLLTKCFFSMSAFDSSLDF